MINKCDIEEYLVFYHEYEFNKNSVKELSIDDIHIKNEWVNYTRINIGSKNRCESSIKLSHFIKILSKLKFEQRNDKLKRILDGNTI